MSDGAALTETEERAMAVLRQHGPLNVAEFGECRGLLVVLRRV